MPGNKSLKDALTQIKEAINGTYSVRIALQEQESVDKLDWLKSANRDFLKTTTQLQDAASKAMEEALKGADLSEPKKAIDGAVEAAGEAIHLHIANRFNGKREYRMRPLSKAWIKHKGHSRIGIYSGDLFRDFINGKVVIKRLGNK